MKEKTYEGTKKTQNGLKRMFFSVLAILLQAVFMVYMFTRLNEYAAAINTTTSVLAIVLVLGLYNREQTASMTTPWIILILAFPIMGVSLYLLVGLNGAPNKMRARFEEVDSMLLPCLPENADILSDMYEKVPQAAGISTYLAKNALYPVYQNTDVTYYDQASKGLEAQLSDLSKAKKFIFMEYHAIEDKESWHRIQKVLTERVQAGVEVRVFYDDMGSIFFIDRDFSEKMEKLGIKCRVFNPVAPAFNMFLNNRDHRKITVIDGTVGFCGGVNLADEYINAFAKYGHWKDTAVKIEGEAVRNLTALFIELWNMQNTEQLDMAAYLRKEPFAGKDKGIVVPYGDGPEPFYKEAVGKNVYLNMIHGAREYLYITTPYLICDYELMSALKIAAKKGVDVKIVTPHIPDKKLVFLMTRSSYEKLIKSGVKVYEYTPGFIHAKNMICDDKFAVCGTINMDYRSLVHHFECAAWMYDTGCIYDMKMDFLETTAHSEQITGERAKLRWWWHLLAEILKIFTPLL